jgi:hypothetical protein
MKRYLLKVMKNVSDYILLGNQHCGIFNTDSQHFFKTNDKKYILALIIIIL